MPSVAAEEVLSKVTTLTGQSYEQVKVVSRSGETVKIMHSGGFKILSLKDFGRKDAISLGLLEYEVETQIANEDAEKKKAAENLAKKRKAQSREANLARIRAKNQRSLAEWTYLLHCSGKTADLSTLKELLGRPPDAQAGDTYQWYRACWNRDLERMDTLVLSTATVPRLIANTYTQLNVNVLKCGSTTITFDRSPEEFLDQIEGP